MKPTADRETQQPTHQKTLERDMSKSWKCYGCSEQLEFKEPVAMGAYCCPGCGMALLRPASEFEASGDRR